MVLEASERKKKTLTNVFSYLTSMNENYVFAIFVIFIFTLCAMLCYAAQAVFAFVYKNVQYVTS